MEGGTTFHFVTDGIESALRRARAAAGDRDVRVAGGAQAVQQFIATGLLDRLIIHIAPVLMRRGASCSTILVTRASSWNRLASSIRQLPPTSTTAF